MAWLGRVSGGQIEPQFDADREPVSAPKGAREGSWWRVVAGSTERYAEAGSPLADIVAVAAHHGLDPIQPDACEAEAAAWHEQPGIDDATLEDLRTMAFVTIDYEHSRDLDQAVFVERDGDGFTVWYALADAAYYVRPGSALFEEALKRAATYYLPGLIVPMLPLSLCEDLISLNPNVDRRALVFRMHVGPRGRCITTDLIRARVHSRAKLAYEGVQRWYDGGPAPTDDPPAQESLLLLREVGEARIREAESRDVVRYRRSELDVRIGERGLRFVAQGALRHDVERYGEQISLLANVEGARFLRRGLEQDPDVQPIYRTHQAPAPERLERLATQIGDLVSAQSLDAETWAWEPGDSLGDYLRRLPLDGSQAHVAKAINRQALYATGRSGFSPEPAGHYGVGAEVYARFTAPMREVVGIFLHKEATDLLAPSTEPDDPEIRERVIEGAERARKTQRRLNQEANRLVLDQLFEQDHAEGRNGSKAPWRWGTVMGLSATKVHVQLDEPPLDVKMYQHDLEKQLGTQLKTSSSGSILLRESDGERIATTGDRVQVRVGGFDGERDRWRLELRGD